VVVGLMLGLMVGAKVGLRDGLVVGLLVGVALSRSTVIVIAMRQKRRDNMSNLKVITTSLSISIISTRFDGFSSFS